MFINHMNPIVETDFANVEVHIADAGIEGRLVSIIWQDDGHVEDVAYFQTTREAWKEAFSLWRYEKRRHPDVVVAIVY